ncbi:MAG: transposase [Nitrospirae bacterium]|nr:transposase [Nitrospirota bacterium]
MARPLRIEYDGALYHITSRGNEKKPIYKDDTDRNIFLDALHKVNKRYNWICHGYCLMNNHYHLMIETPDGNLSKGMRQLNGVYTQIFNNKHNRVGHIFQGRYKAILIQKENHLLEVCRYVVLNPVRAKSVEGIKDWKWSSYHATAGIEKSHSCLTTDWILGQFAQKKGAAEKKYREFVEAGTGEKTIWEDIKGQSILGSNEFVENLIGYVKGHEDIKEIPKCQRHINRPALKEIFNKEISLNKKYRNKHIKEAVNKFGYTQKEVADSLGLFYTTISRIVNDKQ